VSPFRNGFAKRARFADEILLIASGGFLGASAQTPEDTAAVLGIESYTRVVADMERSVVFYRDVLNLEVIQPPSGFENEPHHELG
jgi:hypothetical protein